MSTNTLPKNINPVQLAAQNKQIQGRLPLVQCERLLPSLRENTGCVDFSLQFMQDEGQRTVVRATMGADLVLECRRCLKSMIYPMRVKVDLAIVTDDVAATDLPECYEPLLVIDSEVALESLIEDELLLNLPVMASHSDDECSAVLPTDQIENELDGRKNPFATLKNLLRSD
jgi:uncharacterized protein